MCLAVPGKIVSISNDDPLLRMGRVSFGGLIKVSLAYVCEAQIDNYVIVHAGFALSIIDRHEAEQTLNYLRQIDKR